MPPSALALPTSEDVAAARRNIRGFAVRTPLLKLVGGPPGVNIYLKLENLQPLGSFKIRPALNVLKTMDPERLRRGVLTASAGNFGQGLAFAAREIGRTGDGGRAGRLGGHQSERPRRAGSESDSSVLRRVVDGAHHT